jgi:hypothetical protein
MALVTVKPKRGGQRASGSSARAFVSRTKDGPGQRLPPRMRKNSDRFLRVVSFNFPPEQMRALVRPTGACGPWHGGEPKPSRHLPFPCACGSHGGACAQVCSVDTCASRYSPSSSAARRSHLDACWQFLLRIQYTARNGSGATALTAGSGPFRQEWKLPLYKRDAGASQLLRSGA